MAAKRASRVRAGEGGWLVVHLPAPVRRHPWRTSVFVLVTVIVGAVAYTTGAYLLRSHPGAKSVADAARELPTDTRANTPQGSVRYVPPPTGVYRVKGSGTERISFPPNSQDDGAVMPVTVTSIGAGCWRWHQAYNVAHWDEYDFCPRGDMLALTANRNSQTWNYGGFSVSNLATFTCPVAAAVLPASISAGQVVQWTCTGTNTAVAGKSTATTTAHLLGTESLSVGNQTVRAVHERQETALRGSQIGTVDMDWWFSRATGLPVRTERHITISTSSPLGNITYTESGSWQIASLVPTH